MSNKAAISIASLGAGLALFAMVAKIQDNPFSFTSATKDFNAAAPGSTYSAFNTSEAPIPTDPPHEARLALNAVRAEMGPIRAVPNIGTGMSMRRASRPMALPALNVTAVPAIQAPEEKLVPCSPWMDLGPKLGNIAGESTDRHVRQLC